MQKIVLITGCSSGVGLHTALQFAEAGWKVYASMRDTRKSETFVTLRQGLVNKPVVIPLDVQDEKSIEAAIRFILEKEGRIDTLVNNAGYGLVRSLEQATTDELDDVFDVNYFGVARCVRLVLPHMRAAGGGHIIAVTSVGGLVGQPMNEIYCSAKFAVEGLFESMATYAEPYFKVKMTLIEPAGIKTEFVNRVMKDMQKTGGIRQDAYEPILKDYLNTVAKRGTFESNAQTPAEVARVIVQEALQPSGRLRVLTSETAIQFCAEKLAGDGDGTLLQKRIRKQLLGLDV